jgi:hypothetical protein
LFIVVVMGLRPCSIGLQQKLIDLTIKMQSLSGNLSGYHDYGISLVEMCIAKTAVHE